MTRRKESALDRRQFLRAGLTTTAAFSLSGLTLAPRRASAAAGFTLVAESATRVLVDGTPLPVWQFRDLAGPGPGALPAGIVTPRGDRRADRRCLENLVVRSAAGL